MIEDFIEQQVSFSASREYFIGYKQFKTSFNQLWRTVFLFVLAALAYNIGIHDSQEYVKISGYMAKICDPIMGEDRAITWNCTAQSLAYKFLEIPMQYGDTRPIMQNISKQMIISNLSQ